MYSFGSLFSGRTAPAARQPVNHTPVPGKPFDREASLADLLPDGCRVLITPKLAARILTEARCQYHVPPATTTVNRFDNEIKAGFREYPKDKPLWFALLDGKPTLLNGWARLLAVVVAGVPVHFWIRVTKVGSQDEIRALATSRSMPRLTSVAPASEPQVTRPATPAPITETRPEVTPLDQILQDGRRVLITPALAARLEEECLYERERELREDRLNLHLGDIAAGRFTQGSVMSFGLLDRKLIRVDGRHRTHAVIRSGKAQTFLIAIYPVTSKDELAQLYAIFDTPGSVRDPIDAAGHLLAKGKLTKREVRVLLRAVPFIQAGFRLPELPKSTKMAQSPVARNDAANACYTPAVAYFSHIESAPRAIKETLHRQAIAAFGIYTFQHQSRKATEFWGPVATLADEDKGMARTDPRRALYKRLQASEESMPMQLHIVAAAWNAFFEGRKLREIRVRGDNPFRIAGTPIIDVQLEEQHDAAADDSN
jgi:hypothetical protein